MVSLFLDQKEYYEEQFRGLKVDGQSVEAVAFYDCVFEGCSFRETVFKGCAFHECRFKGCDLALVNVERSVFKGALFEDCQIVGVNWARLDLPQKRLLKPFDFRDCVLNYSTFMGLDLKEVEMLRCVARGADFSDANLTGANCQHTDFGESRFANTDLTEADFCHARDYQIDATLNKLKKTRFTLPEAMALLHSLDIELVE